MHNGQDEVNDSGNKLRHALHEAIYQSADKVSGDVKEHWKVVREHLGKQCCRLPSHWAQLPELLAEHIQPLFHGFNSLVHAAGHDLGKTVHHGRHCREEVVAQLDLQILHDGLHPLSLVLKGVRHDAV